VLKFYVKIKVH